MISSLQNIEESVWHAELLMKGFRLLEHYALNTQEAIVYSGCDSASPRSEVR